MQTFILQDINQLPFKRLKEFFSGKIFLKFSAHFTVNFVVPTARDCDHNCAVLHSD